MQIVIKLSVPVLVLSTAKQRLCPKSKCVAKEIEDAVKYKHRGDEFLHPMISNPILSFQFLIVTNIFEIRQWTPLLDLIII